MINRICKQCKKHYQSNCGRNEVFCSKKCQTLYQIGKPLSPKHIKNLRKAKLGKRGKFTNHWKGGKIKDNRGYIIIRMPEHPFAVNNYVPEHRLVMEKHIGRYLKHKEIIHHINHITDDNRIENLMLCPNLFTHRHIHKKSI